MPRRSREQRRGDVPDRLERETDIRVASADAEGLPCLVPLWFVWDGEAVRPATRPADPTGRNPREGGRTWPALGDTRDVVLLDGEVETYGAREVPPRAAEAFREKTGWDPRADRAAHAFFRVRPQAVRARHGVRETPERHLLRDGIRPAQGASRRRTRVGPPRPAPPRPAPDAADEEAAGPPPRPRRRAPGGAGRGGAG
ncbi:pyridoxamine 5'-phosphate oxidase [Streptomyces prasinopilosus]|uniref:pyridoxamine 5'-phosphate oxidase n=1 Tax=Streptomyces prasinopilosus TaxID=67344 RepID=UPI000AECCD61